MGSLIPPPPITGVQPAYLHRDSITREPVWVGRRWVELYRATAELPTGTPLTCDGVVYSSTGDPLDLNAWSDEPSDWDDECHACAEPACETLVLPGSTHCRECEAWESAEVPDVTARVRADVERVQSQGFTPEALREFAGTPTGRLLRDVLEGDRDAA